MDSAP